MYAFFRFLINLRSKFILNKMLSHRWKVYSFTLLADKFATKYKWGVSYSVFDGEELLESSLLSIRKSVDYINVVYQRYSWHGNPCNHDLVKILTELKNKGLIDELIEYVPNYKHRPQKQQRDKRNIGLKYCKKAGVNYFMTMDTDEFYKIDELELAKRYILKNNIQYSFCNIVNYGLTPTQRSIRFSPLYVQFFSKITKYSNLNVNFHIPVVVDPTRKLRHRLLTKYFVLPCVEMHHMSYIRKNLDDKFINSSAKVINNLRSKDIKFSENMIDCKDEFNLLPVIKMFTK